MKFKLVLIIAGIVVLAQVLAFARIQSANVAAVRQDISRIDGEIARQHGDLASKNRERDRLLAVAAAIPPEILTGFDDPEVEFVEFLDFLNDPAVRAVDGRLTMRQAPRFITSPIPLHETQFNLQFSFLRAEEAEEFLNFLMYQRRFPVEVNTLRLSGGRDALVQGDLAFTYKVPARLKQPLPIVAEKP